MTLHIARTAAEEVYADLDNLPDGFAGIRKEAQKSFVRSGLPNRRVEEYKWTDLKRLVGQAYPPVSETGIAVPSGKLDDLCARSPFGRIATARLVFVNGRFDAGRSSMPQNISVEFLAGAAPQFALRKDDPVDALNLAYATDGAIITVTGKTPEPLELMFITAPGEPATVTTRNVIKLAKNAAATIFETHTGHDAPCLTNAVTNIEIGNGATLNRVRFEDDGAQTIRLANTVASLGQGAVLHDFALTQGSRTTRNQTFVTFTGQEAIVNISGAYMIAGQQHVDTTLVVNHAVPMCQSRELFKCVMDENARGIFQGKVIVAPGAQKTDGQQSANALLLSQGAEFDAKPELEIYADDVWCGHGATSGDLDQNQLFYLRARGIPERQAKALLIAAFAAAAFDEIENEAVRDAFNELAHGWLERRTSAAPSVIPAQAGIQGGTAGGQ